MHSESTARSQAISGALWQMACWLMADMLIDRSLGAERFLCKLLTQNYAEL